MCTFYLEAANLISSKLFTIVISKPFNFFHMDSLRKYLCIAKILKMIVSTKKPLNYLIYVEQNASHADPSCHSPGNTKDSEIFLIFQFKS